MSDGSTGGMHLPSDASLRKALIAMGAFALVAILVLVMYLETQPKDTGLRNFDLKPATAEDKAKILAQLSGDNSGASIPDSEKLAVLAALSNQTATSTKKTSSKTSSQKQEITEEEKLRVLSSLQVK